MRDLAFRLSFKAPHRVVVAAVTAMTLGLVVLVVGQGLSTIGAVRFVEQIAIVLAVGSVCIGGIAFIAVHLAGWRNPESEEEFEELVRHSEALAYAGLSGDDVEEGLWAPDPFDDQDFAELVREALDDLPDMFFNALDNVPVVISDGGRRQHAYGLYQGGTLARSGRFHDRILIFRDTLRRDFGGDPDLLRDQVTRVVRHELAHHVGFDELGVESLGL